MIGAPFIPYLGRPVRRRRQKERVPGRPYQRVHHGGMPLELHAAPSRLGVDESDGKPPGEGVVAASRR